MAIKKCENCGKKHSDKAPFCPFCKQDPDKIPHAMRQQPTYAKSCDLQNEKLLKCNECEKEISKKTNTCPNCGAKNNSRTTLLWWAIFLISIFLIWGPSLSNYSSSSRQSSSTGNSSSNITNAHYASYSDIKQAEQFLSQLPAACNESNAQALPDGTISIRILCRNDDQSLDGVVQIKDGIVQEIR